MNVGSLFSGIGGIEIGFEQQGYTTEWFVEKDLYAQTILRKQFPYAKIYDDITQIDFRTVPKVDILTGGFPCQDISNAGKRTGIEGSRSSLWKYYLKAIRVLRPRFALIENVSALLDRGLNVVLADLASVGYDAEWYCVSASAIGALHRRDRIFIIAYPMQFGCMDRQPTINSSERGEQTFSQTESSNNVQNSYSVRQQGRGAEGSRGTHERQLETEIRNEKTNGIITSDSDVTHTKSEEDVYDSHEWGVSSFWERGDRERESSSIISNSTDCDGESRGMDKQRWSTEPELGRVVHGISNRVDRIKCLGNAVVPQLAEIFAKAIKEYEGRIE